MTVIKICGITNLDDALVATEAGADVLGFNFYQPSPRYITPAAARGIINQLPESILTVGVFVNEAREAVKNIAKESGIKALQLHGDESPEYCRELAADYFVIKTFAVSSKSSVPPIQNYAVQAIMLDTKDNNLRGGTGRVFDWSIAREISKLVPKLYLAGGLSPENVRDAIETVEPYAVDACSALEDKPGQKNQARVRAFVEAVRSAY